MLSKTFILLGLFAALNAVTARKCGKVCGVNESRAECDAPCQASCVEPNPPTCMTFWCGGPDCVCKDGYIRGYDNKCVLPDKCVCPPHEKPSQCEEACPKTCAQPDRAPCPSFACNGPKCVCADGYIREFQTGLCILESDCPIEDEE